MVILFVLGKMLGSNVDDNMKFCIYIFILEGIVIFEFFYV